MTRQKPVSCQAQGVGPLGTPIPATTMWNRLKEIVGEALELPTEQQEAAVRAACGDDTTLFAQARTILRWSTPTEFLDQPAFTPPPESSLLTGRTIGAYLVEDLIARGGMGAVYRATHQRTGQTAALKVLRYTFGVEEWERRFQHEVQILGQLRHQSIAQIHDAGVVEESTGEHLPYFAI